jgi:hypothetical protein
MIFQIHSKKNSGRTRLYNLLAQGYDLDIKPSLELAAE